MTSVSALVLFATAFVSATLWPLGSEVVYLGLLHQSPERLGIYWSAATLGNTLGAVLMLVLARAVSQRLTPDSGHRLQPNARAHALLERAGTPLLVLAWLPVVGDLLPVAAGWLRLHRGWCVFWIALGKGARFAILSFLTV